MLVKSNNKKKTYQQPTFSWDKIGFVRLITSGEDVTKMWNDNWNEMF